MKRPCLFLDRDGVINRAAAPGDYIRTWDEFHLLPNIADWIRKFNRLDYLVIVVTNQRGIALGLLDTATLEDIHRRMVSLLGEVGARIDEVIYCPHAADSCNCRKPAPGMIEQACTKWDIDLSRSLLIGDSWRDEELARRCGILYLRANGDGTLHPDSIQDPRLS